MKYIDKYYDSPIDVTTKDGQKYRLWKGWRADSAANITGAGVLISSTDSLQTFHGTLESEDLLEVSQIDNYTPAITTILGSSFIFILMTTIN